MDEMSLAFTSKRLAPPLNDTRHKGQAGRIGIFGGSLEYTGAPYFAAISCLKVGADLVHVFCAKEAGPVIKSYSPELIVHALLDDKEAVRPGLGREPSTFSVIAEIIKLCRDSKKPLIIDADGLFLVTQRPDIIKDYPAPGVILTPNAAEFARLIGQDKPVKKIDSTISAPILNLGKTITVLVKGAEDVIIDYAKSAKVIGGGSGRRCGGQGDLLAGSLATFYTWALQHQMEEDVPHDDRAMIACFAACKLTRECNARAFEKTGRGMVCSDMIEQVPYVFRDQFEVCP
ncbi:hypothetical protein FQR65_LT08670 [Abscondita terminalis]|nr:hypothetical protein FQR65_LT08670 [Abscondita terminalis]